MLYGPDPQIGVGFPLAGWLTVDNDLSMNRMEPEPEVAGVMVIGGAVLTLRWLRACRTNGAQGAA
jgi:hypothetical protein